MSRIPLILVVGLGLSGCKEPQTLNESRPQLAVLGHRVLKPVIWIDAETGCQYLQTTVHNGDVLTPRLGPEGRPICGPPKGAP